jgi:hypothetical protein
MPVTRSNRTVSPTPSDKSDTYWETFDNDRVTPSPAPSETADAFSWERDSTPVPMDSVDATPTPRTVRISSPASVVEISQEDFPPLEATAPAAAIKPRTKNAKDKGKKKATTKAGMQRRSNPSSLSDAP